MQVTAQAATQIASAMALYARAETAEDYVAAGQLIKATLLSAGATRRVLSKTPFEVAAYVRNKVRHGIYAVA